MTTMPPPIPSGVTKKRRRPAVWIAVGGILLVLLVVGVIMAIRFISAYGLTEPMDRQFGDQHLKTSVALLELHKVRFGQYPDSLADLEYIGDWDLIALRSVAYYPSEDRQSYYVEVVRGWVGKPSLSLPDGFWQGTGYDPDLKPKEE